ncbi:MAG: putative quinol monooxygenase [Acidimicrobiales bacterium]|jgi:quinol monooxygenase YgiN
MFTVRVAVRVLPEGRSAFLAQLEKEAHEVPELFDGCERYGIYSESSEPESVFVYEEWTSRAAFDVYRTSDYFMQAGAVLYPLMDGVPDSAYYESERVNP